SRIGLEATRKDGPATYQAAILGQNGGVDREHNNMNSFLNVKILPELLPLGKVGVFIDAPLIRNNNSPYIYTIKAEDIFNWEVDPDNPGEYIQLLIRQNQFIKCKEFNLPFGKTEIFKLFKKTENGIQVTTFDKDSKPIDELILDLPKIPFIMFELTESLLTDVSSYQIALLNLSSSDMTYAYLSNIPLYVEQISTDDAWNFIETETDQEKKSTDPVLEAHVGPTPVITDAARKDIIGSGRGRTYVKGLNQPDFINPSPEPLKVSMEKAQEIKDDIRALINLSLSNVKPRAASAESKIVDERGLESGLSAIGLELEAGENAILEIWSLYEEITNKGKVTYPTNYELKDDKERRQSANDILELKEKIPSSIARIELTKDAARELFGSRLPQEKMDELNKQLETVGGCPSGAKEIQIDHEEGLVTAELASVLRGYPIEEAEKAQKEKAERQAKAVEAQRGSEDFDPRRDPNENKRDEQNIK
ncbi:MAG: hypothetical protein QQN41_10140, partial [Nitrosopumilus sp.]